MRFSWSEVSVPMGRSGPEQSLERTSRCAPTVAQDMRTLQVNEILRGGRVLPEGLPGSVIIPPGLDAAREVGSAPTDRSGAELRTPSGDGSGACAGQRTSSAGPGYRPPQGR